LHTFNEWIAFAAVISLAGASVSLLTWVGGRSQQIEPRRLLRVIASLWACIILCAGGLVLVRHILGGGVFDYDAYGPSPVRARSLSSSHKLLVGGGVLWTALWLAAAVRIVRPIAQGAGRHKDAD